MVTLQNRWLMLHYRIPVNPSAPRVYIWRKLKRMGALLIMDTVWVLPDTPRTLEQFQWLAAEIIELGGEALLWQGQPALNGPDENLRQQFLAQVDEAYTDILKQLQTQDANLELLSRLYQQIKSRDYFNSATGEEVREELLSRRGGI
ncbi:MAG: ChrB protein [Chloroflexi bacterium]|nr:ChrB protein [Chloroflexota bacterium]